MNAPTHAADAVTVTAEPFTVLGSEAAHRLGRERTALWSVDRALFAPEVFRARRADGALLGFVLLGLEWGDAEPEIGWLFGAAAPGHAASETVARRLGARRDSAAEAALGDGTRIWRHGALPDGVPA